MKKSSSAGKLILFALLAGVVVYFLVQVLRYTSDTYSTVSAYRYTMETGIDLSGTVVRDERVIAGEGGAWMRLRRDEGERVPAGGVVAEIYADEAALERRGEVETLQNRISQLEYAQESLLGAEASLKLDGQIEQAILDYRTGVASGRLGSALERGAKLRTLVIKRDYTYSGTDDLDARLKELQQELKTAKSRAEQSVRTVKAPEGGLYSAVTDGYETVLTPAMLSSLTPSALASAKPDEGAKSQLGKLIRGKYWYYAATVTSAEAETLRRRAAATTLHLRFSESADRAPEVTLVSVNAEEGGRCVVVLRGETYLQEFTLLRRSGAEVITGTVEGIRVPLSAIRTASTTVTLEDGSERQQTTTGVYCIVGAEARFKPVEVLYSGDGFAIVESTVNDTGETTREQEKTRLRQGDEVIVSARNLYDGKVML